MPQSRTRKKKKKSKVVPMFPKQEELPVHVTSTLKKILNRVHEESPLMKQLIEWLINYIDLWKKMEQSDGEIQTLKYFYRLLDMQEDNIKPADRECISCKKGCSFCCHIEVGLIDTEVKLILDYVKEYNIEIDTELLKRQQSFKNELDHMLSPDSKCVFLNEKKECSIYPVRPIACRKYFVQTPPELCNGKDNPENLEVVGVLADYRSECIASATLNVGHERSILTKMLYQLLLVNHVSTSEDNNPEC